MYIILLIITNLLNAILYILFASFLLTPRYSLIKATSIYLTFTLFLAILKFYYFPNINVSLFASLTFQAVLYLFFFIEFKDSVFKKILVLILIIATGLVSEYSALMINNIFFHADYFSLFADTKEFFIINSIGLIGQIIISVLIILIWRAITRKKNSADLFYFTLMSVILLLLIVTIFAPLIFNDTALNPIALSVCITISLIACIILFYYVLRRNKEKTIEDAYEELKELYSMDLEYYKELEKQHEELAKLRHDYQNQLATLYMLISSGKHKAAMEFADSLKEAL